jgi:hypothetical protein
MRIVESRIDVSGIIRPALTAQVALIPAMHVTLRAMGQGRPPTGLFAIIFAAISIA